MKLSPATDISRVYSIRVRSWFGIFIGSALVLLLTLSAKAESLVAAMPLISRGGPAFASGSSPNIPPAAANDANYQSMWVSDTLPAWIAYDLSTVPVGQRQQVLVAWYASWALGYINTAPAPSLQLPVDYTIDINFAAGGGNSAPTTGWQTLVTVTGNNRGSRQHLLDLAGANWIRLRATAGSSPTSFAIDLEVHSAPAGASDCWLFMGDSITGFAAYLFSDLPGRVNALAPGRWPVVVPAAIGGSNVWSANDVIDNSLALYPGRYVTLNYGTNGGSAGFSAAMEILIQKVVAAGKIPVIPHMPWSDIPDQLTKAPLINAQIDALYLKYPAIFHGPDLYAAFLNRPDLIPPGDVHPNDAGNQEMRRQWALAMTATTNSNPTTVSVNLAPDTPTVATGATQQFTATVSGTSNTSVLWTIQEGSTGGIVSTTGLYTAPATAGTYHIVVTSVADSTKSATSTVTVAAAVVVNITPSTTNVSSGTTRQFSSTVTGSSNTSVTWSVQEGSTGGAINSAGLYSAPNPAGTFHVKATSVADTTKSATATVTVAAAPTFTSPPQSQPAFVGTTITLSATANSTTTLTYQWQKEGINIPGATANTLILPNAQLSDAGNYALIATNAAGSSTSRFARLVVLVPQPNAIAYGTTVISTGVTAGGIVNMDYFVTNTGTKAWGTNHYLSIRDASGTFVAWSALIGALPGENKTANLNFPAPQTPGTYTYFVQALENGVEFFSTQTTVMLTVLAVQPNSMTYNTTTFPISVTPGTTMNFNYNVTNTGTKTWGATHQLALSDSQGVYLMFAPLNGVAAGQSKTVNLSFTAPPAPGVYTYSVQGLDNGVEFFNTKANLTLIVLAPRPNAMVYHPTRFPDAVMAGAQVNLRYSLSNAGTQTWGSGHYISLRDANGSFLSFVPLTGVTAGGNSNVEFNFTTPTTPGIYTYYVQALENGIEFFSTQDVVVLTVLATPMANAITYNATTFPATATPGGTVNFTSNVTNLGTKTWGTNHFLSLRDVDNNFLGFLPLSGMAPGTSKTFNFSFVAPTTTGLFTYTVQALESGIEFFAMADGLILNVPLTSGPFTPVTPTPVISSFTASPTSILIGGSTTLSWLATGATSVSISPGVGTVTGTSVPVSPATTTTYTLTATNAAGSSTQTCTVNVSSSTPTVTISGFTAMPSTVIEGNSTTLNWNVTGATSLSISPGVGPVTGTSITVTPATTTTYTLTATKSPTTVTQSTTVTITPVSTIAPVISSFTIDSASLATTGMCTLLWDVKGNANLSISPNVGPVTGNLIAVSPTANTTYTLSATNAQGTVTAQASVVYSVPALTLEKAPALKIKRDDHVATIEMDFDDTAWAQLWDVDTIGRNGCGYRVQWWADATAVTTILSTDGCTSENSAGSSAAVPNMSSPRQLVTPNRVIQIQPLANNVLYHVSVVRLNGLGQICSPPTEQTFNGGDGSRVAALRSAMTFFDDFNLPMGAPDERKWNNAMTPQTDPRFNLFFVNDQCHVHTLNGTLNEAAGDKSQVAQRVRKPIAIETGVRRRIVFDMDGIFSPRGVWYLDFNPVKVDLTGHMSFFDDDGEKALPAGVLRLKAGNQSFSVHMINNAGASYKLAEVILYEKGRKMSSNVRRSFDVRLGTDGVQVFVDGTSVIDIPFAAGAFKPGTYDLLWSTIGYNSSKDNNPYFLSHWDNFGFDGPDLEPRAVHNYVTRIEGTDYQHANAGENSTPTFTVNIPDDIRPTAPGATSEAWLVFNYMVDRYNYTTIKAGDHVLANLTNFALPQPANNTAPLDPTLSAVWNNPTTVRIKLGEVQQGGVSPLLVGNNTFQFFAENTGILNLHVEVFTPKSAEPPYTPPSALHRVPMHAELPKLGPPAQIVFVDGKEATEDGKGGAQGPTVSGKTTVECIVGNSNWANWDPQQLNMPANSTEIWSSGGTTGIKTVELFLRKKGVTTGYGDRIAVLTTSRDAPAPQIRYVFEVDTRRFANGDYELYVLGTTTTGVKSHPTFFGSAFRWDPTEWGGAYEPVRITITN